MRATVGFLLLGVLLSLPTQSRAEEIVYFTNGTYMHVASHEVKGDMVRVRLDGDAALSFPSRLIEKIEGAYGVVFTKPGTLQANQAAPRAATTNADTPYPVGINPALASRASAPAAPVPPRERFTPGGAMSGEGANNKYLDGSILDSVQPGPSGSHMVGNHLVIDGGKRPGGRSTFTPSPFQAKPGLSKPNNGLPSSPFPAPASPAGEEPTAGARPMPVEEPVPDQPEPEGGP